MKLDKTLKLCANTSYPINRSEKYIEPDKLDFIEEGKSSNTKIY